MTDRSSDRLKQAAEELNTMTPDSYLELIEYVDRLEKGLPELPCRVTVKMFSGGGYDTMFTLLDVDDDMLYDRLVALMSKLKGAGFVPERHYQQPKSAEQHEKEANGAKSASAPAQQSESAPKSEALEVLTTKGDPDVTGEEIDRFSVNLIQRKQSDDGKYTYLLVKGGRWMRWGFRAWPEVLPPSIKLEAMELGKEVGDIPADLQIAYARTSKGDSKIIAFARILS